MSAPTGLSFSRSVLCFGALVLGCGGGHPSGGAARRPRSSEDILRAIAHDIEGLKPVCPQLADFSETRHLDLEKRRITFNHHVDTTGNPQPDGITVRIDISNLGAFGTPQLYAVVLDGAQVPQCYKLIEESCKRHVNGSRAKVTE